MMMTSYDRSTDECRIANQQPTGGFTGRISSGMRGVLGETDLLETVLYPLPEGPLCYMLRAGVPSSQMEKIDGYDCVRIEIPTQRQTLEKYTVWLDPDIGYNPRKVEFVQKSSQPDIILFKDYKQIGNGVWFPTKQTLRYGSNIAASETFVVENTVTQINICSPIPKEEVLVDFPSGTEMLD